jgi:hypothetical protein
MLESNPDVGYCEIIPLPNARERKELGLRKHEDPETILVQTDWDLPGIASSFGWSLTSVQVPGRKRGPKRCDHRSTDGTITCKECGADAGMFIDAAREWIDSHDGKTAQDPGYFS